jgi:hypothetical protein
MATRTGRLAEFKTDEEPQPGFDVELLCEDHNGTYVLPFPCQRSGGAWRNTKTGESVQAEVVGWRSWDKRRGGAA